MMRMVPLRYGRLGHRFPNVLTGLALAATLALPAPSLAQQTTVSGRVIDAEIAEPVSGAIVELVTGTGRMVQSTTTGEDGQFRLTGVAPGTYALLVSTLGYETYRQDRVSVGDEPVAIGNIAMISRALKLNPVVVTASRQQEKALNAPASVYTVSVEEIEERPSSTTVDHIKGIPGVDVVKTGMQQHNVVARGFNNVFSGALFVLTDNRWASVPSLRLNAYNLIPTTNEDIERIEVQLGPGSALYGPNVDKGVMHIITRSPLTYQGTTVSVVGGERDLFQGSFRHAGLASDDVGYKISGMYFRANDWKFVDPAEQEARATAIALGANPDTLLIGQRDFTSERFTADARVDWRMNDQSTLVFAGGTTGLLRSLEMTGIGMAQADNWFYTYLQARLRVGELFAQTYVNFSNAGDSYTLRDANQVVDKSMLYVGQVQHASDVGERQRFVYGADLIRTMPRTEGSIHGRNEDDDNITEVGGYVQSETELSEKLDFVAAGRLDWHSVTEDWVVSPRAAIVFKPTPEHSVRFTYNRAFSQPTSINFSLDLFSSPSLGPFADFGVRALGVPSATGLTFRRDCGGLCMRSPFETDPGQFLSLDVAPYWGNAVDGVNAILAAQGQPPLAAQLEGLLRSLGPAAQGQIGTVLKKFDAEALAFGPTLTADQAAIDVQPLKAQIANTIELGYKGLIADRLLLGVDVYYQKIEDFIGPLRFETANAFLNPADLGSFLQGPLSAAGLQPSQIAQIVGAMANVPLGTITPEQVPSSNPTDLYVTYRNFGDVDFFGLDLGLTLLLTDEVSLTGSYSLQCGWIDSDNKCENFFPNLDNIGDIALNAPRNKATLAGHYRNPRIGLRLELRGRYVDSYPVNSGVFVGNVTSFTLLDANASYKLPISTAPEITVSATNVLDDRHREMVGAPQIGRLVMVRLSQSF